MAMETMRDILMWCSIINLGILLWWFVFIVFANNWAYKVHSKFFKISKDNFDTIHYAGGLFFKVFVFMFNIVPYCALLIMGY